MYVYVCLSVSSRIIRETDPKLMISSKYVRSAFCRGIMSWFDVMSQCEVFRQEYLQGGNLKSSEQYNHKQTQLVSAKHRNPRIFKFYGLFWILTDLLIFF